MWPGTSSCHMDYYYPYNMDQSPSAHSRDGNNYYSETTVETGRTVKALLQGTLAWPCMEKEQEPPLGKHMRLLNHKTAEAVCPWNSQTVLL